MRVAEYRRGTHAISGNTIGIIVCALLFVAIVVGGVVAYRRALPGGQYEGSMAGGVTRGAVLGLFLGLAGFLATLEIVLIVRAFR